MQHHVQPRDVVTGNSAATVLEHEVDASVPEAVLLSKVTNRVVAPFVSARRILTDHEPMAAVDESIADVVVVAVAEVLVEQTHCRERAGAIRGIARAHMIDAIAIELTVALLQVETHHARPYGCVWW